LLKINLLQRTKSKLNQTRIHLEINHGRPLKNQIPISNNALATNHQGPIKN